MALPFPPFLVNEIAAQESVTLFVRKCKRIVASRSLVDCEPFFITRLGHRFWCSQHGMGISTIAGFSYNGMRSGHQYRVYVGGHQIGDVITIATQATFQPVFGDNVYYHSMAIFSPIEIELLSSTESTLRLDIIPNTMIHARMAVICNGVCCAYNQGIFVVIRDSSPQYSMRRVLEVARLTRLSKRIYYNTSHKHPLYDPFLLTRTYINKFF